TAIANFASPIVPGATGDLAGEILIGELNCVACHAAGPEMTQRLKPKVAPDLSDAAARLTPQYLNAYLNDPHGSRPGSMMPDPLHGLDDRAETVDDLTHYLMSRGTPPKEMLGGSEAEAEAGKKLYHSIGCATCHKPENGKFGASSIPLDGLASKTTVAALAAFLQDPHKARPSGRMPNFHLDSREAKSIAVYLLREQLSNPQNQSAAPASTPGLNYTLFHGSHLNNEDSLLTAEPKEIGTAANFTLDAADLQGKKTDYAYLFEGSLSIEEAGNYQLTLNSDDSSFLWIDDKKLVGVPGAHPMKKAHGKIELSAGPHRIRVIYVQAGGGAGLEVTWQQPGGKPGPIPDQLLSTSGGKPMLPLGTIDFTVDPAKSAKGEAAFTKFGCASCHSQRAKSATPLAKLKSGGCLAPKPPASAPHFALSANQRAAISKTLANVADLSKPLKPHERVNRTLAKLNCVTCHKRGNTGGPGEREALFTMKEHLDLGDEGRFPPALSGVGRKLRQKTLSALLARGKHYIRPHMATRMPTFGKGALGSLAVDFVEADAKPADLEPVEFDAQAVTDGRHLVGNTGLGCINCHRIAGHDSLGINTVDIANAGQRLNPAWLRRFLDDPAGLNPGTVMPGFWPNGTTLFKDIAGGDVVAQQNAIYSYLTLGSSLPLPKGIQVKASGNVLIATDAPLVLRTFVDGASPRGIVIGYPERIHAMFNANQVSMVKFWRGAFFDPKGAWSARNMKFNGPASDDVLELPGPTFAQLEKPDSMWPVAGRTDRDIGGKFRGYRLDKDRIPILTYQHGDVAIEERLAPELAPGGAKMGRQFTLTGKAPEGLFAILASGKNITPVEGGIYDIDSLTLTLRTPQKPIVRDSKEGQELLLPIPAGDNFTFEVIYSW
ncbi:MAG: mono/diheme cytochrome c family protein, partial [Rhodothermales bacterium]